MNNFGKLSADLASKLAEMEAICAGYGYEVTATLLLRHDRGPTFSMLLSNDDLNKVVLCIAEKGGIGEAVEDEQPGADKFTIEEFVQSLNEFAYNPPLSSAAVQFDLIELISRFKKANP